MKNLRRSWLLVPAIRSDLIERCWTLGADIIVLDLEDLVHDARKPEARAALKDAIPRARKGGAEIFVRCNLDLLYADLEAAVWPGLTGIVLPKVRAIARIHEAEELLAQFEQERGVSRAGLVGEVNEADEPRTAASALEIHLALENAAGNHQAESLLQASPRIRSVSLGRADLVMDLRPEPQGELHLLPHLMQRLIIVANAVGCLPIGAWWQANSRGLRASAADTLAAARLGRAAGFKGAICLEPEQVEAVNQGFTPSADELQGVERTVRAYAQATSEGRPFARVGDLLVGAALAGAAQSVIDQRAACAERDSRTTEATTRARTA